MDFKTVRIQVKDIEPIQGIFTGYASTFGVMDDGNPPDIVEKGSFVKSIGENGPDSQKPRIKCLYQHDFFSPIGKPVVLKEDNIGLYHETKVAQTTLGKDVLTLIAEGVITEQSIGYDPVKADMDQNGVRHLREIRLWEYSPVTWGMNSETPILGVKSHVPVQTLAEKIQRAEKAIRRGDLSNEELVVALRKTLPMWRDELKRMNRKDASGKSDWPLADRDATWDAEAAHDRVLKWASDADGNVDWKKYASVHFWFDGSAPDPDNDGLPDRAEDYKLPFCDVIDDEIKAMPRAIFKVAAVLNTAVGEGGVDIPDADRSAVKQRVEAWYTKMAKAFDDSSIVAPWNQKRGGGRNMPKKMLFKAPDFNQLMSAQQMSDVLWQMWYALRESIEGALFDEEVTDKVAEVSKIADQFKTAIVGWTQTLQDAGMLGYDGGDELGEAITALANNHEHQVKAGRVLSQDNMDKLKKAAEHIAAVIESAEQAQTEPSDGKGAHSAKEPDAEVVHSVKTMLSDMELFFDKRGA